MRRWVGDALDKIDILTWYFAEKSCSVWPHGLKCSLLLRAALGLVAPARDLRCLRSSDGDREYKPLKLGRESNGTDADRRAHSVFTRLFSLAYANLLSIEPIPSYMIA